MFEGLPKVWRDLLELPQQIDEIVDIDDSLKINKDKLKSLFSKIKQSGILNSQIINEIMMLVYCIFSSLFISINYLENKLRVMNSIPPIVMITSQNSQINEIKTWTNKMKSLYVDLILSNYKLE